MKRRRRRRRKKKKRRRRIIDKRKQMCNKCDVGEENKRKEEKLKERKRD